MIFFELDNDGTGHAAGVNTALLVPDAISLKLLPTVVAGYYPKPIDHVALEPADKVLESVYGKKKALLLLQGNELTISAPVEIELKEYRVSIECDSRAYWSTSFSIKPISRKATMVGVKAPHGC